MTPFQMFILNDIQADKTLAPQEYAAKRILPPVMVKRAIGALIDASYILETPKGYYITFIGAMALERYNAEKSTRAYSELRDAISIICRSLNVLPGDLRYYRSMDKGMTNASYFFELKDGRSFIYRRPGEGSDMLVDRFREYANYLALEGTDIADTIIYHSPLTGVKITEFLAGARNANPRSDNDVMLCMQAVRAMHARNFSVRHEFNFEKQIRYYEELCIGADVDFYDDYVKVKMSMLRALMIVNGLEREHCFCHIDSVPNNCLIDDTSKKVTLIDWEYAGMCDPLADPAMYCLSAAFGRERTLFTLNCYLGREPNKNELMRFYGYLCLASFMWSLWALYKAASGEDYGAYCQRMTEYTQTYSNLLYNLSADGE